MRVVLTVPGNLLIAGEYVVLEPGGLGIAVAVDVQVVLSAEPSSELEITGAMGPDSVRWSLADRGSGGLIEAVVGVVETRASLPALRIHVDSAPFFQVGKLGYGSSAAVAAALTAVLLRGPGEAAPGARDVFEPALAAHRVFQGGSGYDIAASLHGGVGLFRGGSAPEWEPVGAPWLAGAQVFRGRGPVRTPGATARYRAWREARPEAAGRHLERSNALVRALLDTREPDRAREILSRIAGLGVDLGEMIGVGARIEPPPGTDRSAWVWKALGAGDEIGLLVRRGEATLVPEGCRPLEIAARGLVWH